MSELHVVALGAGTSHASAVRDAGTAPSGALADCHGEVLARRALFKYIGRELEAGGGLDRFAGSAFAGYRATGDDSVYDGLLTLSAAAASYAQAKSAAVRPREVIETALPGKALPGKAPQHRAAAAAQAEVQQQPAQPKATVEVTPTGAGTRSAGFPGTRSQAKAVVGARGAAARREAA